MSETQKIMSMWGPLPAALPSVVQVLCDQIAHLEEATAGLLTGSVVLMHHDGPQGNEYALKIRIADLSSRDDGVVVVSMAVRSDPARRWPVQSWSVEQQQPPRKLAHNLSELLEDLRVVLQSARVREVIGALLGDAKVIATEKSNQREREARARNEEG